MTKNGKMQEVMMRVLAVMLVASFLLAALSFVLPTPVAAGCYTTYYAKAPYECGTCPDDWGNTDLNYYLLSFCREDPCAGWGPYCTIISNGCEVCD